MERPAALPAPDPSDDERLVAEVLPVVGGWCRRLAAPGVDAEAAAHDVMIVLLRQRSRLGSPEEIWPFAWGVTTRVVRTLGRRAWLRRWLPGARVELRAPSNPLADYAAAERARQVHAVMTELDSHHREILVLCDVEERSRAEVATLTGVPAGTVKSRLRLARAAFQAEAKRQGVGFLNLVEGEDG